MPRIPFPKVPKLPGVPQLLRSAVNSASPQVGLGAVALGRLAQAFTSKVQWGIFDRNQKLVVEPDSIVDFGFRNEFQVSTFPVQQGAFASYNKVANPYEIMVKLSKGGTKADREQFIANLESLLFSLEVYVVMTPEKIYENVNLTRYEVTRRGVQGAYFFADVELFFLEIREVPASYTPESAATVNSRVAAALPPQNVGRVQALVNQTEATLKKLDAFKQKRGLTNGG